MHLDTLFHFLFLAFVKAVLLIEDGMSTRDIGHKMETESEMKLYRLYHSTAMRIFRGFIMFTFLFLAFLEDPNSLTITPDPTNEKYVRPEVPR